MIGRGAFWWGEAPERTYHDGEVSSIRPPDGIVSPLIAPSRGLSLCPARRANRPDKLFWRRSVGSSDSTLRSFRSLAPLWCCQAYPACFSTFSCFCRATELPKFCFRARASFDRWDVSSCGSCPQARVGQGSLLSGMSGVTAQDARYASLKRNERAQSTNGL